MTTVVIPKTSAELEEMLIDPGKMKEVLADPAAFADFTRAYARAAMDANNGELGKQLKEGLQAGLGEYLRENGAERAVPDALRNRAVEWKMSGKTSAERALWNKRASGARAEGIFEDFAELAQATWNRADRLANRTELAQKLNRLTEIMNAFGSEVPSEGGFLIPETMRSELLQVALETAVVRSRATVIPMSSLRVPIPFIDDTSHATSVFGGVICYWTEEAAALTASAAKFGKVTLDARKLTAYADIPNELLADAPAMNGFFGAKFPQAIAWFEDVAFMTGTGVGEPEGFVDCPASVQVAAEAGQAAATIVWENIVKMYSRMLPTSHGNAVWIASHDTFPELATMALSVGTGGGPVWINSYAGGGANTPPMTILGRPVIFTEKAKTLGTTGDISYVDLSYYLIGDRQHMETSSSQDYKFANDLTSFRVIERVDGRPWLQSAITPQNGSSSTLTPFVQLATR